MVSGQWRATLGGALLTSAHTNTVERAQPILIPAGTALQSISVNVTSAGAASTVVRLGARADVNGRPGTLLADFGTVAGDAVAAPTLAISFTVPAPRIWLTATPQGGAPTLTSRAVTGSDIDGATAAEVISGIAYVAQIAGAGALPASFTSIGVGASGTLIVVQAA